MDMAAPNYTRQLADGYVLRWSTANDRDNIMQLYGTVFREEQNEDFNQHVADYAGNMLNDLHPLAGSRDFAVVQAPDGSIVAATVLMNMAMEYAGVAVPSGRPEIVATHPDARNRGYIRNIFELIHARSDHRGDLAQGITGIPYFYRKFDYEYAVDLGGSLVTSLHHIPAELPSTAEPFHIRRATHDDVLSLLMLYERVRTRQHHNLPLLVTSRIDAAYMRWAVRTDYPGHEPWAPHVITNQVGEVVGSFWSDRKHVGNTLNVYALSTEPQVSLHRVMPAFLHGLHRLSSELPLWHAQTPPITDVRFVFGIDHPAYPFIRQLPHKTNRPYGWYIRVADLAAFLNHIKIPLERRLAQSAMAGYTGTLNVQFYSKGLQIRLDRGTFQASEWRKTDNEKESAAYPPLVMLQQIFGKRSFIELKESHMDVYSTPEAELLLDILFPKQTSWMAVMD